MKTRIGLIALLPVFAGCGFAFGAGVGVHEEVYYEDVGYAAYGGVYFDADYGYRVNYRRLPIPRGHVPPPGRCRVWLPGVPPGQQARRGSCAALSRRVPGGAWLIVSPRGYPGLVEVIHYSYRRPGLKTRYVYDVRTKRRVNAY